MQNSTAVNRFLLIAFSFLAFITSASQGANAQEWAKKMFKEHVHDFGKVPLGEVPEYRFEIQNIYREPISIQSVSSSCGCTKASATKNYLKTWEKAEIVCKYDTPTVGPGNKQATISVRFAGQFVGEAQLTVKGTIVGGLLFEPESLDFGQAKKGMSPTRKVRLTHSGDPNFQLVDIKSTFNHIKIRKGPVTRNGSNVSMELFADLKESIPTGFSQGELFIVYVKNMNQRDRLGNPLVQQTPLKFSAKISSPLQISPGVVTFGVGKKVSEKILLTADKAFKITDVRCQNKNFSVKADNKSKKLHVVEVVYRGGANSEQAVLNFFTDLGDKSSGAVKAILEGAPE